MNKSIEIFVSEYLTAQTRAMTTETKFGTQYAYQNDDKEILCDMIKAIQATTECSLKDIATYIVTKEGDPSAHNKHLSRMKGWLKMYNNGGFKYLVDPISKVVISEPEKQTETQEQVIDKVVLANLKESIKAICKAGLKNSLTGGDLCNMFEDSFNEVVQEIKVKAADLKLKAFLRENNIDKEVAFQILENY